MATPSWVQKTKKEKQIETVELQTRPSSQIINSKPSWANWKPSGTDVEKQSPLVPPSLFKDYDVDKDTSLGGRLNKFFGDLGLKGEYEKIKKKDYNSLHLQYGDKKDLIDQLGNMSYEDFRKWKYQNDKNINWKPSMTNEMPKMNENNPAILKTIERPFAQATNTLFGDNAIKKTSTGNKVVDIGTDIAGSIMGLATPVPGAGSLLGQSAKLGQVGVNKLSKVAPKLTQSKLGSRVIEGAIAGVPIDIFEGIKENDSELGKRALRGAALGAVADVGLYGVGKGIGALKNKAVKETIEESTLGLNKGGKGVYRTPQAIEMQKQRTEQAVKKLKENADLEEYLNNLEYQDYINGLDPNYVRNENAFRGKVGGKYLDETPITKVVMKKERFAPPKTIDVPKVTIKKERLNPEQQYFANFIKENDLNIDDFINETRQSMDKIKGEHINYLNNSGGQGIQRDLKILRDTNGDIITSKPTVISNNPKWYQDFYAQNGRKPTKAELEQLSDMHLSEGFGDTLSDVPANGEYLKLKKQLQEYEQIKKALEGDNTKFLNEIEFEGVNKVKNNEKGTFNNQIVSKLDYVEPPKIIPKVNPKIDSPKLSEETINQVKGIPVNTLDEAAATSALKEPPKVTIPQTPQPKAKVVQLPDIGQGGKNRQFAENSMLNSDAVPESMKKQIKRDMPTYEPITNKETWERASSKVNSNPDRAVREYWENPVLRGADDTALGEALIVKSIKEGNISEANRLTADLAEKLTRAGQTVQAASMMKRMTPEGFLMYAQRQVNNINKEIDIGKFGKKIGKLQLTQEDSAKIIDFMSKAQSLEGRDKDVAIAQAAKVVQDKIPSSAMQKLKGFQIISMLANPKTQVRNVLGNVIFGGAENISNVIGAGIDKGVSKFTGQRTTLLPDLKMQGKSMVKGAKETLEDSRLGINTSTSNTQFDIKPGQTFKGGLLGKIENVTGTGLQLGDRPFYKAAYDESLRQQMKIAGVTKPTQEIIEKATQLAEYRTYQDVNKVTQLFQGFQKTLNKVGTEDFGLGNVVMPFPKTPANILARALDYSPAGMFKVVRSATKNGFDQKAFVDSLSRSLTGTGAILLGYKLAKNGVITGQSSKDKDLASLEKSMGKTSYAFNTTALKRLVGGKETAVQEGDVYRTYDWAQPISIPLAIGADIFLGGKDEKDAGAVAINALRSGGTTLFQQSLLQGLQRFMGGSSPVDNVAQTFASFPSQLVPSLFKQANQMVDSSTRETYDPNLLKYGANLVKAKIPGLSNTLPIKYDTLGRPVKQFQGRNNPYNVMFNPGYTTRYKPNDVEKNLYDLYKQSGDASILPRVAPKSVTYKGRTYSLTPKQMSEFQKNVGQKINFEYSTKMSTEAFNNKSTADKVKALKKIMDKIYNEEKEKLVNGGLK